MFERSPLPLLAVLLTLASAADSQEVRHVSGAYFSNTFELGQSFYSLKGSPADKPAFTVRATSIKESGPQESSTRTAFRRVDSASQAYSAFSFEANLSADFIVASVDGRVFTGKEHRISKSSTTIACYVKKLTGAKTFKNDVGAVQLERSLNDDKIGGRRLSLNKFLETYGDAYVSEVYSGATLFAIATLSFSSEAERKKFEVDVNAGGFGSSLDMSTRSSLEKWSTTKVADVEFKSVGGPTFAFNSGDIAGLIASVESFTSGITKENSSVVGYNLKSYRSFSGIETVLDGEMHRISNREIDAEFRRLLAFSGVRHTLKNAVSAIGENFVVGGNPVSLADALKELNGYGEAIARRAEYVGKYGQLPDSHSEAADPKLLMASASGAEDLLKRYADLRIERSGTLDVPFNFYASPGRPAEIAKSDGEVDSGTEQWTRMKLSQTIDGNTLVSRMTVIEGKIRAVPIMPGNRNLYGAYKQEKKGGTVLAVINPTFKDADDTILKLSGRNPIPYQVRPGEEVAFQLAPQAGEWTRDVSENCSDSPRKQLVPIRSALPIFQRPFDSMNKATLEKYGLKEVRATLDSKSRNDHHVIGCDGISVVRFTSVTRGESLLNEYLSSF